MWTVVYLANNADTVRSICCLLDNNGILNRISEIGEGQEEENYYNVLVPAAEVSKAHTLILDNEL